MFIQFERRNVPLPESERIENAEMLQFESLDGENVIYTFKLASGDFIYITIKAPASYLDRDCDSKWDTQADLGMFLRVIERISSFAHRFIVINNP